MRVCSIINYQGVNNIYSKKEIVPKNSAIAKSKSFDSVSFSCKTPLSPKQIEQMNDLKVFHHHIYEFKKGIRTLILTTEKSKHKQAIEQKLKKENIDYVIHDVDKNKINVFFGEKPCVDVVKTLNPKLSEHTPQEDFMLGILLGYDKVKQCERYLDFRARAKQKWSQ